MGKPENFENFHGNIVNFAGVVSSTASLTSSSFCRVAQLDPFSLTHIGEAYEKRIRFITPSQGFHTAKERKTHLLCRM